MVWKSNVKFGVTDLSSGSIFELKGYGQRVTIHKIHGYGNGFYLTCRALGYEDLDLGTEDFTQAIDTAKKEIRKKVDKLRLFADNLEKDTEVELTRY